jgi:hypothetical protein
MQTFDCRQGDSKWIITVVKFGTGLNFLSSLKKLRSILFEISVFFEITIKFCKFDYHHFFIFYVRTKKFDFRSKFEKSNKNTHLFRLNYYDQQH